MGTAAPDAAYEGVSQPQLPAPHQHLPAYPWVYSNKTRWTKRKKLKKRAPYSPGLVFVGIVIFTHRNTPAPSWLPVCAPHQRKVFQDGWEDAPPGEGLKYWALRSPLDAALQWCASERCIFKWLAFAWIGLVLARKLLTPEERLQKKTTDV